ncbi:site-2 protease family protein [Thalassobacillus sp. CUG 92003]|uniref:site-2 protease family protein n=1 Tax=Thalassobacillus sp. CUG 92003 TaxID=2736641 RepID=UPI0015E6EE92|nr:site-2 protease family protein [Thalassobacillus sp. CUG 92003]
MTKTNKTSLVHIHPVVILFALVALLTGAFLELLVLFAVVAIHELGHYMVAQHYNWRIQRIVFWLFGGAMDCEEHGSRPFKEQVLVTLAGPVQHVWMLAALYMLSSFTSPTAVIELAIHYNWLILCFNLLPIWPLDGGKLAFYVLTQFFTYRNSQTLVIWLSGTFILMVAVLLVMQSVWTLHGMMLALFLLIENRLEWKRRTYTFIRYLLYRKERGWEHLQTKLVKVDEDETVWQVLKRIRCNRNHYYVLSPSYGYRMTHESVCLDAYFDAKQPSAPMKQIVAIQD